MTGSDEDGASRRTAAGPARRKGPRRVDPAYLERAALHYLERFATSAANLRRVLLRKVDQSARAHGTDAVEGRKWVDALIERYLRSGLLNDAAYAEMKTSGLRRRGTSARAIRMKLAAKGLDGDLIDGALAEAEAEAGPDGDAEAEAAWALARRRRLGPFRPAAQRAERRDRDLAALARAGFDLDTARAVIDAQGDGQERCDDDAI